MNIKNVEIERTWVVNMGHITQEDNAKLTIHRRLRGIMGVVEHKYGVRVRTLLDPGELEGTLQLVTDAGFSESFINLLRLANGMQVEYINLDQDGSPYPELPAHEW